MKIFNKKKRISEIINLYDVFFFDLYGVTHNGVSLFPDILNIFKKIKILKKKVLFISNAPRQSVKIKKFLKQLGLNRSLYFDVITSGDITRENYLNKLKKKKYYFIGSNKDKDFCRGLNIFEEKNLKTDVIISRAFKPLPVLLEIALTNFKNFKYIILFLGKSGKEILKDALRKWRFDYEVKKSLTNEDSLVIKISNIQKKNG